MADRDGGLLVAIGVGAYEQEDLLDLGHARSDVEDLRAILLDHMPGAPLLDPDEESARRYLRDCADLLPDGGALTFLWAGHGIGSAAGELRLLARDSRAARNAGLAVTDVAADVVASGASQLLLILDTCYSGAAADEVSRVVGELVRDQPPAARQVYVGVITSCLPYETARDGLLGQRLRRLLREGPQDPDLRRRWSAHCPLVSADDLGDALVREWDVEDQRPRFVREGVPLGMLPNPLYDPAAPQQVVEHLLRAARGGDVEDERSWFTGRAAEVDRVVAWVTANRPGVHVVTGKAGTGKSAIVGRVVSSSNPSERAFLLRQGPLGHDDPGEGTVDAVVHARAVTVKQVARSLDEQLVGAGVVPPHDAGRRNAAELVGAVQRAHEQGLTPVVVVDGLDEARGHVFDLVDDLIQRFASCATVVVATRDLPGPRGVGLVETMVPDDVIDLADVDLAVSTQRALHDYVVNRLTGVDARMEPALVADHVSASTGDGELPFLLGRLVTDELRSSPVDTGRPGWEQHVATSVAAAFELDLVRTSAGDVAYGVQDARQQLTALTWAFGAGLPEDEWRTVTASLTGHEIDRDDVSRVLEHLGRYVVQDGEDGTAVYRIAHQALADHLRPGFVGSWDVPFDPSAAGIAIALVERYRALLDAGVPAGRATYLWRHCWQHCAAAGPAGVQLLRELAADAPELRLDVALAIQEVTEVHAYWGRHDDALPLAREAAASLRVLASENADLTPLLADALEALGFHLGETGHIDEALAPAAEAVELCRRLAETDSGDRPALARTLINHANRLNAVGERVEAMEALEVARAIYEELATSAPVYRRQLASVLNNLGNTLAQLGRVDEALVHAEEAVSIFRVLAEADQTALSDVGMALNNLCNRLGDLGRLSDALAPAEQALAVYQQVVSSNPAFTVDLAGSFHNLGGRLADLGRHEEAAQATEEAVRLFREVVRTRPVFLPELASALNSLGSRWGELHRSGDAIVAAQEAVELYRRLAEAHAVRRPDLAMALDNLACRLGDVGMMVDAVRTAEEATTICQELVDTDPGQAVELARIVSNLAALYADAGRLDDALAASRFGAEQYRLAAQAHPSARPSLARALSNFGNQLAAVGRFDEVESVASESIQIRRDLAAEEPARIPELAAGLTNLALVLLDAERATEALVLSEEAVALFRLFASEAAHRQADLAKAVSAHARVQAAAGSPEDAVELAGEAVELYRSAIAAGDGLASASLPLAEYRLAERLFEVNRPDDAVRAAQSSVEHQYDRVVTDPAGRYDLLRYVVQLVTLLTAAGRAHEVDRAWDRATSGTDPETTALLVVRRSEAEPAGTPRTAPWLQAAAAVDDGSTVQRMHAEARRHHRADAGGAWADGWRGASGAATLPGWLTVDTALVERARQWVETGTWEDEGRFLLDNAELLDPSADVAVAEALLPLSDAERQRYEGLRERARVVGAEGAYRTFLGGVLARRFIGATNEERREVLANRWDDLIAPECVSEIEAIAYPDGPDGSVDPEAHTAVVLVLLADSSPDVAEATLEALDDVEEFDSLLQGLTGRGEAIPLGFVATLAWRSAQTRTQAATARFAMAVADGLQGDVDSARRYVLDARRWDDSVTATWINLLAGLIQEHPTMAGLVPELTAALPADLAEDDGDNLQEEP